MIRLTLAVLLGLTGSAFAQTPAMPMPMPAGQPQAGESPATAAFMKSKESMMAGMDAPYTGNTDRDFVEGMLPHHQGAIDMARVELRYGTDPVMRKLAHDIVVSQSKEQILMRNWLTQHPPH